MAYPNLNKPTAITLITDCSDNFALNQVTNELRYYFGDTVFYSIPEIVPSFNTIANSFLVSQHALRANERTLIFHNVAPRKDDHRPRQDNEGEKLLGIVLNNESIVVGPNSGYSLSGIKSQIKQVWEIEIPSKPSTQFRSRDKFPKLAYDFIFNPQELKIEHLENFAKEIPEIDFDCVFFVDSFGNIKTNIVDVESAIGEEVNIELGNYSFRARVGDGAFHLPETGEFIGFVPGSNKDESGKAFYELFFRGASAAEWIVKHAKRTDEDLEIEPISPGMKISIS